MKKAQEFRDQSVEELKAMLVEMRSERFQAINELKKTQKTDQPHLIRNSKKEIARLLTVLCEKERETSKR